MTVNLQGLRVLNTRPSPQNLILNSLINKAGGEAIAFPTLTIEPLNSDWLNELPALTTIKYAIFISANAVTFTFQALQAANIPWPATINSIAIGKATAQTLKEFSLCSSTYPEISDSEHLLKLPFLQNIAGQKVILFKGEGGRELLADTLLARHADLTCIPVYRRIQPRYLDLDQQSWWQNKAVDIILFTSQQGMLNLFSLFAFTPATQSWLKKTPCIVISPRLAVVAKELGIKHILTSDFANLASTLHQFNQGLRHGR